MSGKDFLYFHQCILRYVLVWGVSTFWLDFEIYLGLGCEFYLARLLRCILVWGVSSIWLDFRLRACV